jgi:hypothetical protein
VGRAPRQGERTGSRAVTEPTKTSLSNRRFGHKGKDSVPELFQI